ncbi:MAG: zinc-ribbon domain-containing protein [Verrucomicrobia bacterium]|nr:zinc-ribbon domain-containing protein [Verrucomicrobiota bacterium]
MHACRHCGRENQDDAELCAECGLDFGPSAIERAVSQVRAQSGSFFRWRAASIILIILMVIYGLTVPLNLWLATAASQRGDLHVTPRTMYWAAFWSAVVAILCFAAWRLMQRQSRVFIAASAWAVAAALFIVMRTWVAGLLHGQNPFPVLEAVLTWLPMLYAIIYALRESKRENAV